MNLNKSVGDHYPKSMESRIGVHRLHVAREESGQCKFLLGGMMEGGRGEVMDWF